MLAWQHAFGDINPQTVYSLNGGAQFGVVGTALDEDVALLEAGVNMDISSSASLSVSYTGAYGGSLSQHGGTATFSVRY